MREVPWGEGGTGCYQEKDMKEDCEFWEGCTSKEQENPIYDF